MKINHGEGSLHNRPTSNSSYDFEEKHKWKMSNYPEQEIIFCTKFSQDKMNLSTKKYTNMPTYGITKSKVIALCHKDTSYGCQSDV